MGIFNWKRRNVTFDTNVLLEYVLSKKEDSLIRKAIAKAVEKDNLMLTDVILDEAMAYERKDTTGRYDADAIRVKLIEIAGAPIIISPIPDVIDLKKMFEIDDEDDLKILWSAQMTNSVIIVTSDKHYFHVSGVSARILTPDEYLYEEEFPEDYTRNKGRGN